MLQVMLSIEIMIAVALVIVILLQRSEGGALGMGGGGGSGAGFGGFMSARGAANLLTRTTAILAAAFIAVALILSVLARNMKDDTSVFDENNLAAPMSQDLPADDQSGNDQSSDDLPAVTQDDSDNLPAVNQQEEEKDDGSGGGDQPGGE